MKKDEPESGIGEKELDTLEKSFNELWSSMNPEDRQSYSDTLRSIIRSELENLIFDTKCDGELEPKEKSLTDIATEDPLDERSETMPEAEHRRRRERKKKRERWSKEIKKKQEKRHKCQKKSLKEELQRWKTLAEI